MPLHPQVLPMIELLNQSMAGLPATDVMEISTMREVSLAPPALNPTPVGRVEDRRIPGPAGEIPVRIYTPEGSGPFPLIAFFHGGGFVLCSLETHDELCRATVPGRRRRGGVGGLPPGAGGQVTRPRRMTATRPPRGVPRTPRNWAPMRRGSWSRGIPPAATWPR